MARFSPIFEFVLRLSRPGFEFVFEAISFVFKDILASLVQI